MWRVVVEKLGVICIHSLSWRKGALPKAIATRKWLGRVRNADGGRWRADVRHQVFKSSRTGEDAQDRVFDVTGTEEVLESEVCEFQRAVDEDWIRGTGRI
jgi:hypothetical protein